jgi:hypothetical protein
VLRGMLVVILALLAVELFVLSAPKPPFDDFISYWAPARLNAHGADPYDPALVLAEQRTVGWPDATPYRSWNPPWTLPFTTPFALPPYQWGRFLWFVVHGCVLVWCVDALWKIYGGGNPVRRVAAQLIALSFWQTVIVLKTGQAGASVLLGLVGFLVCERRGRLFMAGAALSLSAIKPQVPVLVWPLLAFWVLSDRRWAVAAGFIAAMVTLMVIATSTNPSVGLQYLHMVRYDSPYEAAPSTISTALRLWFESRHLAGTNVARLAPLACGLAWSAWYFWRKRGAWRWTDELPLVCVVSQLLTPWSWVYDEVILLIPLLQVVGDLERSPWDGARRLAVAGYALACAAVIVMNVAEVHAYDYVWTMPAFTALYLMSRAGRPPLALDRAA